MATLCIRGMGDIETGKDGRKDGGLRRSGWFLIVDVVYMSLRWDVASGSGRI